MALHGSGHGRHVGRGLVYMLLGHQSTPDPKMPLRLLHDQARIWERFEVDDSPPEMIRAAFAAVLPPNLRSSVMTTADMLRAEGRVEARRETLLDQIEIEFGTISAETRASIDRATNENLVAWVRSFVTATTIEEVFREKR